MTSEINRRELVQLLAGAAFALQLPAAEPGAPLFFTKDEFALLDKLTDLIIPTDEHSPGAHDAGVAPFIDRMTAEAFLAEEKETWRRGLQSINALSQTTNGAPFLQATEAQQIALLQKISKNEEHGETPQEKFWGQLKQTTAFAYYTSKIGIHEEMNYKGNVLIREFVGYDAT
ncbi:MAG: gluconate 2-dehydrogenase subunit 3 family protein [Acidobacteriaceae bacterium]|nr:gluconate 2-dehydrogenase subunit 3 family protein [Acidobacteriaceae bacterium]MBV9781954.1 gluconate 2-dehydrogenase subunit 3 family protein [Acidobacteriaceae bacterium]